MNERRYENITKPRLLLIDFNNIVNKTVHFCKTPEDAIIAFEQTLKKLYGIHKAHGQALKMYLCMDSKPYFRSAIYSEYKANRKETKPDVSEKIAAVRARFTKNILECKELEADDVIYLVCDELKHTHDIIVISNDSDLQQIMEVQFYWDGWIEPKFSLADKVLFGKSKDNVPKGTPRGIGPKRMLNLISNYKSMSMVMLKAACEQCIENFVPEDFDLALELTQFSRQTIMKHISPGLLPDLWVQISQIEQTSIKLQKEPN